MKNILIGMMLLFFTFSAQAQDKTRGGAEQNVVKNKNAKYTITVNGNCEQCQRRIQKAAFSVNGVKVANWNVETHKLNLIINEEKTSVFEVKKAVAKVGHDADEVKTTKEIYDKLPGCCQYERGESSR